MNMKRAAGLLGFLLLLAGVRVAQAQNATVAQVLDRGVSGVEGEFVPAAEAMPEDKYSFAPTSGEFKGVRTFAQQVKHVAAVNYMIGAAILEEKTAGGIGRRERPGFSENQSGRCEVSKRVIRIRAQSSRDHQRCQFPEAHQEPLRRRHDHATGNGHSDRRALLRPLRPDGGVPAHEQHRAACQSLTTAADSQGSVRRDVSRNLFGSKIFEK